MIQHRNIAKVMHNGSRATMLMRRLAKTGHLLIIGEKLRPPIGRVFACTTL